MIKLKEMISIASISIILAFSVTLLSSFSYFLAVLISMLLIILINVFTKKITSHYFDSSIEVKIWQFKRWGYHPNQKFKRDFPAGAFFPIFSRLIFFPLNGFAWMASLVFDIKAKVYRAAKRHGFYSFSEMSESHLALIAGVGIFVNLVFAVLAYLIGFSEFAKLSIWFAFFNMIPISDLDGNKIFFGNQILWSFLATITLIGFAYTFLVV